MRHNVCSGICKPGFFDYYTSEEWIITLSKYVSKSNNLCCPVALERTNNNIKKPVVFVSSPLPWPHRGLIHALVDVFIHACSKADKILRRTSSDILQIWCLGCCAGVLNAAAAWTVWMASWENGFARSIPPGREQVALVLCEGCRAPVAAPAGNTYLWARLCLFYWTLNRCCFLQDTDRE